MQQVIKWEDPKDPQDMEAFYAARKAFIDSVIRTQEQMNTKQTYAKVELTYSEPSELYYGRRRGYEVATKHTVKSVFPSGGLCYMAPAMKSRGRRVPMNDLVSVTLTAMYKDHTNEWAAIARSMRKHNINLALARDIEAMLAGETDKVNGCGNRWTIHTKPRTASFKDVTRGQTLDEMWAERKEYGTGDNVRTYFRRMKRAKRMNRGRDRSITLQQCGNEGDCAGSWYFVAASEYEGCGNGSYYLMYSPTRALYLEDD